MPKLGSGDGERWRLSPLVRFPSKTARCCHPCLPSPRDSRFGGFLLFQGDCPVLWKKKLGILFVVRFAFGEFCVFAEKSSGYRHRPARTGARAGGRRTPRTATFRGSGAGHSAPRRGFVCQGRGAEADGWRRPVHGRRPKRSTPSPPGDRIRPLPLLTIALRPLARGRRDRCVARPTGGGIGGERLRRAETVLGSPLMIMSAGRFPAARSGPSGAGPRTRSLSVPR